LTEEPGFRMLAEKAAALPALTGQELADLLDAPSYLNLLRHPQRYQGRPIRIRVRVFTASDAALGPAPADSAPTTGPGRPLTFRRLDCLACNAGEAPIIVYSFARAEEPGKPDRVEDGQAVYNQGRRFELAGVFYRVVTGRDRDGQRRAWPVVLAWQLRPVSQKKAHPAFVQLFLLAIMLLIGYLIVRRSVRRVVGQQQAPAYRPRRYARAQSELPGGQARPRVDVDPRLKAEVQAQRKRTESTDGTQD